MYAIYKVNTRWSAPITYQPDKVPLAGVTREYQSVSIDSGRHINEPNQTRILAACGASDSSRPVIDSC